MSAPGSYASRRTVNFINVIPLALISGRSLPCENTRNLPRPGLEQRLSLPVGCECRFFLQVRGSPLFLCFCLCTCYPMKSKVNRENASQVEVSVFFTGARVATLPLLLSMYLLSHEKQG